MKGFMYILECSDGSYYTGSTNNLVFRLQQHQNGVGANHTKKRLPVKLVYFEVFQRIDEAFYREKQVQGWSRSKKEALINGNFGKLPELSKNRMSVPSTGSGTGTTTPVVELVETTPSTVPTTSSGTGTTITPVVELVETTPFTVPSTGSGTGTTTPVVELAETTPSTVPSTGSGTRITISPVVEPVETTPATVPSTGSGTGTTITPVVEPAETTPSTVPSTGSGTGITSSVVEPVETTTNIKNHTLIL